MSAVAIDTYRLLAALKGTGKSANFTADEIAHAVDVAQEGSSVLTKDDFAVAMAGIDSRFSAVDARMAKFDARMDAFGAKLEALRVDIKAEVKSSQFQLLLWLSGIVLASNGIVIALLGRLAHIY